VISEKSRPTVSQWPRRMSLSSANRVRSCTVEFHSEAHRASARSVRLGPLPPMVIGG
jgi:hypothetical protein